MAEEVAPQVAEEIRVKIITTITIVIAPQMWMRMMTKIILEPPITSQQISLRITTTITTISPPQMVETIKALPIMTMVDPIALAVRTQTQEAILQIGRRTMVVEILQIGLRPTAVAIQTLHLTEHLTAHLTAHLTTHLTTHPIMSPYNTFQRKKLMAQL